MASRSRKSGGIRKSGFRKRTQHLRAPGALAAALGGVLLMPAYALAQAPNSNTADSNTAGAIELGPLRVQDQNANALGNDTGLSVLPTTVQDTPQAIIVIPQQQLREQGVTSLEQALRNVPGITVSIGEGGTLNGDQFKIRGFDAQNDVYVDGLRDFGVYTRDSFAFQEVQVLKGPSGTMFGRGSTGGVINTVSKTPFLGDLYSGDAYAGNGAYYRALADVNKQIDSTTAVRLNLMATSNHVVDRDQVYSHRWGADASVAFGLGTDTKLILNYLHQDDNRIPDYGIPVAQTPGVLVMTPASDNGVPRNSFLGYDTDRDETHADVFTERLSHKATPWLTLTSDTRGGFYSRYFQYTTVDRCDATVATAFCATQLFGVNPQAAYGGIGGGGPYSMRAWGLQNVSTARADFNAGMFRTELIAGIDVSYQDNKKNFYYYTLPSAGQFAYVLGNNTASRANIGRNLFAPDPNPPPNYAPFVYNTAGLNCTVNPCTLSSLVTTATPTSSGRTDSDSSDLGAFLTDRLWFTDELSVIGGLRFDRYNSEFNNFPISGTATQLKSDSTLVSPRASLVYEPDTTKTFYFTWGRAARPQGANVVGDATAIALTTKDLEPEITDSYELGTKYGFLDGRLAVTASLFHEEKNNATQTDPGTGFLVAQSGEKQRVQGFELGLTGKVFDVLTLNAGWSHLDSRTEDSFATCATLTATSTTGVACPAGVAVGTTVPNLAIIGRQVIFVPKDAGSFWASYDAAEFAPGLSFGGGLTYQSKMPVRYNVLSPLGTPTLASIAEIPDTVSLDAFIAYKFGAYRVSINGYNLTDRLNYVQAFGNRGVPAPGRTVILSVGFTY
ncbi:MAG TPA: TonB-dependent receptor [Micropepsaceae bacterium]|jgi:catecholate siderophore receptor